MNGGSSSIKLALFDVDGVGQRRLAEGTAERIGAEGARIVVRVRADRQERALARGTYEEALAALLAALHEASMPTPELIGHRVAHGGPRHVAPEVIDDALLESLGEIIPLAPLHLPPAIEGIRATRARYPDCLQVASFDTAFHAGLPEVARRLPLPHRLVGETIHRYGFHGLSYEYVVSVLGASIPARAVVAHLGSGASLVALRDGKPIDTTMGLTPAGGVIMATRTGDIDPGVLVWLAREKGLSVDAIERLVHRESGLAAITGSSDMKTVLERAASDPAARLGVEMFVHSVKKAMGGFIALLGGIDLLIFTGGIGENAAAIRSEVCSGMMDLGIDLDPEKNAAVEGDAEIQSAQSRCLIRVVPTDEDAVVARHAWQIDAGSSRT